LDRGVERAAARWQALPAGILDVQFLLKKSVFCRRSVEFALKTVVLDTTGTSAGAGECQDRGGEGESVEHG